MEGDQDSRNDLQEMKLTALSIRKKLDSSDPADVQNAMKKYLALVDRFYQGNEYLVATSVRTGRRSDIEHSLESFWILLVLVHACYILYTASLSNALDRRFFENRALPY